MILIRDTINELIITGPGMVTLSASCPPFDFKRSDDYDVDIEIKLYTTISDRPVILKTNIPYPWEQDTCPI